MTKTKGYLIIYVMVITFVLMAVGLSLLTVAGAQYATVRSDIDRKNAAYAARACSNIILDNLKNDSDFTGLSDQVVFDNLNDSGGMAKCSATVTKAGANIQADITAKLYQYSSDSSPTEYHVKAVYKTLGSGGDPSGMTSMMKGGMLIGNGGAVLPAYGQTITPKLNVLGQLKVSSYGWVGTSSTPIPSMNVANMGCGSTSTWPEKCTDDPIAPWYNSVMPNIYADMCAPGQAGNLSKFHTLNTACTLPEYKMPGFDKKAFVEKMTGPTITPATVKAGCVQYTSVPIIPGYPQYGMKNVYNGVTYTVPANATISGTLDLSDLHKTDNSQPCNIVFEGDVYIKGGIIPPTSSSYAAVQFGIKDNYSGDSVTMILNGMLRVNKFTFYKVNNKNSLLHIIDFYSSNSACSNSDTVPTTGNYSCLSNAEAKQSAYVNLANGSALYPAIQFDGTNCGNYDASFITLYAYYGSIGMPTCSLSVKVGALGAQGFGSSGTSATLGIITVDGVDPTFGQLVPQDEAGYELIDYYRVNG